MDDSRLIRDRIRRISAGRLSFTTGRHQSIMRAVAESKMCDRRWPAAATVLVVVLLGVPTSSCRSGAEAQSPDVANTLDAAADGDGGQDLPCNEERSWHVCDPGDTYCNGNVLFECAPDRMGYVKSDECPGDSACYLGACCVPQCAGKECGDDG